VDLGEKYLTDEGTKTCVSERSKEELRKRRNGMKGGFRLSALFLGVVGVAVWAGFFLAYIVQLVVPAK